MVTIVVHIIKAGSAVFFFLLNTEYGTEAGERHDSGLDGSLNWLDCFYVCQNITAVGKRLPGKTLASGFLGPIHDKTV